MTPNGERQIIGPDRSPLFDACVKILSPRHQCENPLTTERRVNLVILIHSTPNVPLEGYKPGLLWTRSLRVLIITRRKQVCSRALDVPGVASLCGHKTT